MIITSLLLAYFSVSGGLSFPGEGLSGRFNIGKFARVKVAITEFHELKIFYDANMSRYPSITGSVPVYAVSQGAGISGFLSWVKVRAELSLGFAVFNSGKNDLFFKLYPSLSRQLGFSVPVYFTIGIPFYLRPDTHYIQSVDVGLSVNL